MDNWQKKRNKKIIFLILYFVFIVPVCLAIAKPVFIVKITILILLVLLIIYILLAAQTLISIDFKRKEIHTEGLISKKLINFSEVCYGKIYSGKDGLQVLLFTKWLDFHFHARNENLKELKDLLSLLGEEKKKESHWYRFCELIGRLTLKKHEKIHRILLSVLAIVIIYIIILKIK